MIHLIDNSYMEEKIKLKCLECEKEHEFPLDSPTANGVFNVFCSDKNCEDIYSARL